MVKVTDATDVEIDAFETVQMPTTDVLQLVEPVEPAPRSGHGRVSDGAVRCGVDADRDPCGPVLPLDGRRPIEVADMDRVRLGDRGDGDRDGTSVGAAGTVADDVGEGIGPEVVGCGRVPDLPPFDGRRAVACAADAGDDQRAAVDVGVVGADFDEARNVLGGGRDVDSPTTFGVRP